MKRTETRVVKIGDKYIGGNNPILIQSMTNTKTKDVEATINQILLLEKYGCDIIRVAVLDMEDANAIKEIKKGIHIPLVADIHFDPELAITAIKNGVDKIRLNPGNIQNKEKIKEIVNLCKERQIPIRIGVNSGSLPKGMDLNAKNMIKAAKSHIEILEELDFHDIVLSLKASNIKLAKEAYELASKEFNSKSISFASRLSTKDLTSSITTIGDAERFCFSFLSSSNNSFLSISFII
jgi:(E)-4-hydroxy-3-methylbut-2-enyl-diphosphate synthase